MTTRVAIFVSGSGEGWIGGRNYIANLVQAARSAPGGELQIVIFAAPGQSREVVDLFQGAEWVESVHVAGRHPLRIVGKLLERLFGRNPLLEAQLNRSRIDVISHSSRPGRHSPFPSIVWIPDLQHRERPEFFSDAEKALRDQGMTSAVDEATTILLSSHAAERDLAAFLPEAAPKLSVLRFVSGLNRTEAATPWATLQEKYSLPSAYFHLPNQFWKHKNHRVVADALARLSDQGADVQVVSTGATQDYRDPEHFQRFKSYLEDLGVEDRFRILGLVPYQDLRGLMQNTVAVINPSYFEGWSTTVEEAKSLGKTAIVSDLAVHREQAPLGGLFFPPDDPDALAAAMRQALAAFDPELDLSRRREADAALPDRFARFGQAYAEVVKLTLARWDETRSTAPAAGKRLRRS